MADTPSDYDKFYESPLASGARVLPTEAPPAERTPFFGWARDTGIDIGRGALGIARDVTGAKAAISTTAPETLGAGRQRENLTALEDIDYFLKRAKTEKGQYYDEHPGTWSERPVGKALETVAGMAPYAPLAATGPAAPFIFGGLGYGHAQSDLHERIRNAPEEELMKDPQYKQYRDQGMDPQAARDQLFVDGSDPTKLQNLLAVLPSVAGNVIGGGAGSLVLSKGTMRTVNEAITDKVLRNLGSPNINNAGVGNWVRRRAVGAIEGSVGGAAMMGGSEATRQMTEQNVGLRQDLDPGAMAEQALEGAATFGVVGLPGVRSQMNRRTDIPYGPPRPTPEVRKPPSHADDLGEDITAVASGQQPSGQGPTPPPSGPGPGGVTPPRNVPPRPPIQRGPMGDIPTEAPPPYAPDIERTRRQPPAYEPVPDTGGIGPGYGVEHGPLPGEPGGPSVTIPGGRREEMPPTPVMPRPETERAPTPEFPEIGQPGIPRPEEFGHEAEPDIPYPDRARLRAMIRQLDPNERMNIADAIERANERGLRLTLGLRGAEYIDRMAHTSPMAVAAEFRRGIEGMPGVGSLTAQHAQALGAVAARAHPDMVRQWASEIQRTLDGGARTLTWNRLPKSMRDALGEERPAVVDAIRRDPRAVVDTLAGQEPGFRAVDAGEPAREPPTQEAVHGQQQEVRPAREVPAETFRSISEGREAQEQEGRLAAEYGPTSEHEAPYLTRRHRRGRVGTEADIGLTRRGTFTEETRPRMQGVMGRTLTVGGPRTETRLAAVLRRAAERREARERERAVQTGNIRPHPESVHEARPEPEPGVEHLTRADREHRERVAADEARRQAETDRQVEEARIRDQQDEAFRIQEALNQTIEQAATHRRIVSREFQRLIDQNPRVMGIAERAARRQNEREAGRTRKQNRTRPDIEAREEALEGTLKLDHEQYLNEIERLLGTHAEMPEGVIGVTPDEFKAATRTPTGTTPSRGEEPRARRYQRRDPRADERLGEAAKAHMVIIGRQIADMMEQRVKNAQDALIRVRQERTTGGRRSMISYDVPRTRSPYGWYSRLGDLNRYAQSLRKMVGGSDTAITPQRLSNLKTETLRGALTNVWLREKLMAEGRYSDWQQLTTAEHVATVGWLESRRDRLQRDLNERERMPRADEGYRREERPDVLQQRGRRDSQIESEINRINRILEGMKEFGGENFDPMDYEQAILGERDPVNDRLYKELSDFRRGVVLDWAHRVMEGIPEAEAIQQRRAQERTRQESAQRRIAHEQPQDPTRADRERRMEDLQERSQQIMEEMDALPQETSLGTRRIAGQDVTEAEIEQARRRDDLESEQIRILNEMRDLRTSLDREMVQEDYTPGRVTDPAVDLTDRRNLPRGASMRTVSDYIGLRSEPGGGGGEPVRQRWTSGIQLTPGRNEANLTRHFLRVVDEVAGDTQVVRLTEEQMGHVLQEKNLPPDTPAFYDVASHRIFIDRSVFRNPERAREVLLHEFGHPMLEVAIERFPVIARRIDAVRQELRDRYYKRVERKDYLGRVWQGEDFAHQDVRDALGGRLDALDNVHEFVTEFFSNPRLSDALNLIKTPEGMKGPPPGRLSLLTKLMSTIRQGLNKVFWLASKKKLLNEATLNSLDLLQEVRKRGRQRPTPNDIVRPISGEQAREWAMDRAQDASHRIKELSTYLGSGKLPLSTLNLSDMEHMGSQGLRPLTKTVSQILDRINATARKWMGNEQVEDIGHRLADLLRVNSHAFEELQNYQHDASHWQVHGGDPLGEGRNKHIGDSAANLQQRAVYPEMKARWDAMTETQQKLWHDMQKSFEDKHNAVLHRTLGPLIDLKKMIPDGSPSGIKRVLTQYILGEEITPREERALQRYVPGYANQDVHFKKDVADIKRNAAFKKLPIWSPAIRKGNFVVEGRFDLSEHAKKFGGTQIDRPDGKPSGQFEFPTEQAREQFIRAVHNDERFRGVRLLDTGDVVYAKDANGEIMRDANGKPVPLTEYGERTRTVGTEMEPGFEEKTTGAATRVRPANAGDEGIVRHQVRYNPLLLEFHERQHEAQARHRELHQAHQEGYLRLSDVQPIRDYKNTYVDPAKMDHIQKQLQDSLTNSKGWRELDTNERAMIMKDLNEAAIRTMASQSARAAMLPRHFALGSRKDMIRNFMEYHRNTARTLAGLEHRSELTSALKAMDDYVAGRVHWASGQDPQGKFGITDARVAKAMRDRAMSNPSEQVEPFWTKGMNQVLRISYLDKLMSPMFTVLQAMEPWIMAAPAMAGPHGAKAYRYLWKAMRDIQAGRTMAAGGRDAWGTLMAGPAARLRQTDLIGRLKDNVRHDPEALALIEHLENHSILDRDSGLELAQTMDPAAGKAGRTLDWADHMTRQLNSTVEGANRAAVGLAAYRLARDSGKTPEQAREYARTTVHEILGNYNAYASAPIFNNPYLRPALQFKRYGFRMITHWARTFHGAALAAIGKLPPEQRAAAFRQLAYMSGTVLFTSGFLGMPTEPIKAMINLTQGITGYNADDAERMAYEGSLKMFGPDMGEFFAKGGFRMLGLGLGQRTGYDSLLTFGNIGTRPNDWAQALGHFVAGAPGAYAADFAQGLGSTANGIAATIKGQDSEALHEFGNAAEKIIPSKTVADTLIGVRRYLGGPDFRTPSGSTLGFQPTPLEAGMQAFGVQPARWQRAGEKRAAMRSDLRNYTADRREAERIYSEAAGPSERAAIQRDLVRSFNEKYPEMQPLTVGDLIKAQRRHEAKSTADPSLLGVTMSRRQQALLPRYSMYDIQ